MSSPSETSASTPQPDFSPWQEDSGESGNVRKDIGSDDASDEDPQAAMVWRWHTWSPGDPPPPGFEDGETGDIQAAPAQTELVTITGQIAAEERCEPEAHQPQARELQLVQLRQNLLDGLPDFSPPPVPEIESDFGVDWNEPLHGAVSAVVGRGTAEYAAVESAASAGPNQVRKTSSLLQAELTGLLRQPPMAPANVDGATERVGHIANALASDLRAWPEPVFAASPVTDLVGSDALASSTSAFIPQTPDTTLNSCQSGVMGGISLQTPAYILQTPDTDLNSCQTGAVGGMETSGAAGQPTSCSSTDQNGDLTSKLFAARLQRFSFGMTENHNQIAPTGTPGSVTIQAACGVPAGLSPEISSRAAGDVDEKKEAAAGLGHTRDTVTDVLARLNALTTGLKQKL